MGAQLPQLPFHERKGQAGDLHKGEDPWAALSTFPAFIPTATPRLLALEVGGVGVCSGILSSRHPPDAGTTPSCFN